MCDNNTFAEDESLYIGYSARERKRCLARRNSSRALLLERSGFHAVSIDQRDNIRDRDREHGGSRRKIRIGRGGGERRGSARECKVWRAYERVRRRERGRGGEGEREGRSRPEI